MTRYQFHLYGSEAFSETEDKRPNIITTNVPINLPLKEIPRDFDHEPGTVVEDKTYEKYFCHLNDQIYMFVINHKIAEVTLNFY